VTEHDKEHPVDVGNGKVFVENDDTRFDVFDQVDKAATTHRLTSAEENLPSY
jgi:hypothetical protein